MTLASPSTRCPHCGKTFPPGVKLCPDDGAVLEREGEEAGAVGTVLDGKYRLDAFISKGGMGGVYRGTHVMLNRPVAVKLINPELVTSPDVVRRFQREARAATVLNHPNIVSVYDLGQTPDGTLYIAMEFVNGRSLRDEIRERGPIAPLRAIGLMRQLAAALSVAHRQGIIHRDLKPHNVMLARGPDGDELLKLVDFGIAKTFEDGTQLTMTGSTLGTPQYMSPEQAEGKDVDARSDLYSCGVILYEMLSGDVPFKGSSTPTILIKHIREAPVLPSVQNPHVFIPQALEAVAMRCLLKDPGARFQTADELGQALESAASAVGGAVGVESTTPRGIVPPAPLPAMAATQPATSPPFVSSSGPPVAAQTATTIKVAAPPDAQLAASQIATQGTAATLHAVGPTAVPPSGRPGTKAIMTAVAAAVVLGIVAVLYFVYFRGSQAQPQQVASSTPPSPSQLPPPASTSAPPSTPAMAASNAQPASAGQPTPAERVAAGDANRSSSPGSGPPRIDASRSTAPDAPSGQPSGGSSGSAAARSSPAGTPPPQEQRAAASSTPAAQTPIQPPRREEPPSATPAAIPENAAVFFQCDGPQEVCGPMRTAVEEALAKGALTSVRAPGRADIVVDARVEILQERVDTQFGNTFATRNYSIELSGEAARTSEAVPMPPPTTLNFDPRYGSERAAEKGRVVAGDVVDRIKTFIRRKRGG